MTKEKAIEILKEIIDEGWLISEHNKCMAIDACEMAIKALEHEACEDIISRKEVIDTIYCECAYENLNIDFAKVLLLQRKIEALSPVTPQPKKGHWIKYATPRCGEQHYKCSSCGNYINFGQWGKFYTKDFKYCPHCGCHMVEPKEGSNKE